MNPKRKIKTFTVEKAPSVIRGWGDGCEGVALTSSDISRALCVIKGHSKPDFSMTAKCQRECEERKVLGDRCCAI